MLKKITVAFLLLCLALSMTACGNKTDDTADASDASATATAQGREYDSLKTQTMGKTTTNLFFEWTVNSVYVETGALDIYMPTEGTKYVVADITVRNIDDEAILVGNYDFEILWGSGDTEGDYAYMSFYDEMFPDEQELAVGDSLSGKLVFEVPTDTENVSIIYQEYYVETLSILGKNLYEDDTATTGDTYCLDVALADVETFSTERSTETYAQAIGEASDNRFFQWTVNSVRSETGALNNYDPEDGTKYIIANITVTNIYDEPVAVGSYDYMVSWGDGENDWDYSYKSFYDGMFPDDTQLAAGESITGDVVFEVPMDAENVSVIYEEYFSDDTTGDIYKVDVSLLELA